MEYDNRFLENVRERAERDAERDDSPLDFHAAALKLGASEEIAERVDSILTERVMRARGAI